MEQNIRNYAVKTVGHVAGQFLVGDLSPVPEASKPRRRGARAGPGAGRSQEPNRGKAAAAVLPAAAMDGARAASRLRVVLGHLGCPSAGAVVSFGLRGARAGRVVASGAIVASSPSSAPGSRRWAQPFRAPGAGRERPGGGRTPGPAPAAGGGAA